MSAAGLTLWVAAAAVTALVIAAVWLVVGMALVASRADDRVDEWARQKPRSGTGKEGQA